MWIRLSWGVLLGSALLAAADVHGTITIERKLTRHNVTASAGMYQRGVAVELGADPEEDPLAFERSRPLRSRRRRSSRETGGLFRI
jgi:hypothetical protein